MNRPGILIVDDHKVVAEGLVRLLGERYEILETIGDGRLVVDAALRLRPDVIVLDMSMPTMSGMEVMHQLSSRRIPARTIILTMYADPTLAVAALKAGAAGFVLKEASGHELITAVEEVLRGNVYLAAGLTKEIVTLMVGSNDPEAPLQLTGRQREVLRLIANGLRAKEVAATLDISTRSVEIIKRKMMQTLNVHSTAELVRYSVEHRLVSF